MFDVKLVLIGMILLLEPQTYDSTAPPQPGKAGAAIAVDGRAVVSKYDVEIPEHLATLVVKQGPTILKSTPLTGQHIQFGMMSGGSCQPVAPAVATFGPSLKHTPHLGKLIADTTLEPHSKPGQQGFADLLPGPILGWLDLPSGVFHDDPMSSKAGELVEFRPALELAQLPSKITMRVQTTTNCVALTPFAGSPVLSIPFLNSTDDVVVTVSNQMSDSMQGPSPGMPVSPDSGASYDFEMFYQVLLNPPAIPPVPFCLTYEKASSAGSEIPYVKAGTGVNCGPANLP